MIAVQLDAEAGDRFAGRRDPVDNALGPAFLDADDDHCRDIGIGAGANQRAEMQVEIGTELQPAIRVRNGQRAFDVVPDGFGGCVRQIVDRQDDDVITHADSAIVATVTVKFRLH